MKRVIAPMLALLLLTGCAAAREPDDLALVRVLGVDGTGPVVMTAVCGGEDGENALRGTAAGEDYAAARRAVPWSGKGRKLSLTGVNYLVVGRDVDLAALIFLALEDPELGASATVWRAPDGALSLLRACDDPTADLELLALEGVTAPTLAQAAAALSGGETLSMPALRAENGCVREDGRIGNR